MGNPVFANSMEISSKSMGGKSICAFPDVCFTPPQTPATPPGVPIPYPNTGMASDTTDGSTSVKIGGQEVMLKDRSSFKQSSGDEAGAAPKKGLINSKTKGKVYFLAWSMDVKVEGENVVRHLDMTTHNHACNPPNAAAPMTHIAAVALSKFSECQDDARAIDTACKDKKGKDRKGTKAHCPGVLNMDIGELRVQANPRRRSERVPAVQKHAAVIPKDKSASRSQAAGAVAEAEAEADECVRKMRCLLRPWDGERDGVVKGCCPGQTPHHIPPQAHVRHLKGYKKEKALCVCMEGTNQKAGSHGKNHAAIDYLGEQQMKKVRAEGRKKMTLDEYITVCAAAVAQQCGCKPGCIEQQLKEKTFKNNDGTDRVNFETVAEAEPNNTVKLELDKAHKAAQQAPTH